MGFRLVIRVLVLGFGLGLGMVLGLGLSIGSLASGLSFGPFCVGSRGPRVSVFGLGPFTLLPLVSGFALASCQFSLSLSPHPSQLLALGF